MSKNLLDILFHYGIPGMRWGVRRTPEELGYARAGNNDTIGENNALGRNVHFKTAKMPVEEYVEACRRWNEFDEVDIPQSEKEYVYEELDNHLSEAERERHLVERAIGNYRYTALQKGHNQYKIIDKQLIDKPADVVDEVLTEMFGPDWRDYL